ncbi:hypothetical protein PanWU01x14_227540, partial [Parasponia andersonii]
MYKYLETTLGNTARRLWDDYKATYNQKYLELISAGANPYNFVNTVSNLITASDPNTGSIYQQKEAMRKLEQIKLNDWRKIVPFLTEFIHYATKSQNTYNKEVMNKLLLKLPGPLGIEIQEIGKIFIEKGENNQTNNIITLAYYIMQHLEKKCNE